MPHTPRESQPDPLRAVTPLDGAPLGWWAVLHSDDLLAYLTQAHDGEEPSLVLARIYLEADHREQPDQAEGQR